MKNNIKSLYEFRDELIDAGKYFSHGYDQNEANTFISHLRDLHRFSISPEAADHFKHLSVPKGVLHVRFRSFELLGRQENGNPIISDEIYYLGCISATLKTIELERLLATGMSLSHYRQATTKGPGNWLESFPLPMRTPGMMEIGIILEPLAVATDTPIIDQPDRYDLGADRACKPVK